MDKRKISIRWAAGPDDLRGAFALRELVFCEEQGVPREEELDERDETALHAVALEQRSGAVIGTLRLLLEADGAKIGRVAVAREWRRRGVALRMLELALDAARAKQAARVRLAAQLDAIALYEKAGFAVESETFEEAGIQHVWMAQRLTEGDSTDG
ncbi:MAG TPA: GNAT family N-acetyltransferase [Solirubrobacteraceae bacterium]|jgi:predicted GNAT family N-acyltransferase|nr:GNAT family N-acetyltransferase [Solirubrobacteraceae bacterium]